MELLIPLDGKAAKPLYEQIYEYIKTEIKNGRLKAFWRLPSTRSLAENLKVSRSTTQLAYDQLCSEGYIEAIPCKGYYVAEIDELIDVEHRERGRERVKEEGKESFVVDFSPRGIDLKSFPFHVWRKLSRNTLIDDNKEMFAAGDNQGERPLREAIRDYLHSARGVDCHEDQIVIGAGSEYLLLLLSQLLGTGKTVAMESPTYKQAYRVLIGAGNQVKPVRLDSLGMNPEDLEKSLAEIAYIMPSHQYPTGVVMPVRRRQELLLWAGEREGRYLIEDDYDSEFRYKGKPVPALQGMDRREKVIYLGTFSKSIAPAIRISYMVLPMSLLKIYRERAGFYASTVSRIDQNILYRFLVDGYYERHLNRMRAVYKGKHDILLSGLKGLEERFRIGGEYAGLHILLKSRENTLEEELIKKAGEKGVKVYGMSSCLIEEADKEECESTVLLGYARLSEDEIKKGTALLKEAWKMG
ncbi:PLP-dependent aminotransferase family protein [Lachnospiraceae bacterium 62-35]